jgi:hypothetical protein
VRNADIAENAGIADIAENAGNAGNAKRQEVTRDKSSKQTWLIYRRKEKPRGSVVAL